MSTDGTGDPEPRRIAILGCGYVGMALGAVLSRLGHDVVGTTTTPLRAKDIESVGVRPAVIGHAEVERLHILLEDRNTVYLTIAAGRRGRDYREVYLDGAVNLLRAAEETAVKRIIYTSSTQVYGQDDGSWVDESSPTEPRTPEGIILLQAEKELLRTARQNTADAACPFCVTVLRLGGIHGPGRDLALRIRAAAGQQRRDGDAYVNLVHLDDIVAALVKLPDLPFGGLMNLTEGMPVKRRELYDSVISASGLPGVRWIGGGESLGKRVDNGLARRTLGLTFCGPDFAAIL